jgi:hypothetical protein
VLFRSKGYYAEWAGMDDQGRCCKFKYVERLLKH